MAYSNSGNDYGNNNQYSTNSYSGEGGDGGGGFTHRTASQASPSGGSKESAETLRPVTIKQMLDAHLPHPDAAVFRIDDTDVTLLTFVGQIRNVSQQSTNVTYKLDDGTGTIEVKVWVDSETLNNTTDNGGPTSKSRLVEGAYARVWGRLKSFNNSRTVGSHVIRPIVDHNEIQYHMLEATATHLFYKYGPPGGAKADAGAGAGANQRGQQQQHQSFGSDDAVGAGRRLNANVSPLAKRIYEVLQNTPQGNSGLHMQDIAVRLGADMADVAAAGSELLVCGAIYNTEDENTYAIFDAI